jgi:hypothetical protein
MGLAEAMGTQSMIKRTLVGVTSGLDAAVHCRCLWYQDMIDAGLMLGPRVLDGAGRIRQQRNQFRSGCTQRADALSRLLPHSYMVGGRKERRFMIQGASALGMMPTTEGAADLRLNLTMHWTGLRATSMRCRLRRSIKM